MDEIMDTKVVQMKFDNAQFRAGVQDTIKQLENLENSLELQGASDGLDNVAKASKRTVGSMSDLSGAVDTVKVSFSALEIAGITAMVRLTNAAINYGQRISNALFGQIIQGGKQRALNIENAKFQLKGLGVAWADIQGDIEYGVQDTAYGLDSAARVASQLVASGVQLGDEMKSFLRGISGVAAMTNSNYDEIGHIFTTVASNGRLMTMQLRELSNRGLNASAVLAKAMGTTEQAVNEMVSKGKIGFKEFAEAMDDAFGEHAKEANATFQGVMSNVRSALSRIGAKFADPTFGALHDILDSLRYDINNINNAMTPIVDVFKRITNYGGTILSNLLKDENFMRGLQWLVVDIYSYLRPIGVALYEMTNIRFNVSEFGTKFMKAAESLQLYGDKAMFVKDLLKSIFSAIDIYAYAVISVFKALKPVGQAVLNVLSRIFNISSDAPDFLWQINAPMKQLIDRISSFISLGLEKAITAIGYAITHINWSKIILAIKAVIGAIILAVKYIISFGKTVVSVSKAIVAAFGVAFAVIGYGISKLISAFKYLHDYVNGIGIFSGIAQIIPFSIQVDDSSIEKSADNIEKQAERITKNLSNINKNTEESVKNVGTSSEKASNELTKAAERYDKTAEAAKNMASDVEKASNRVNVASKNTSMPSISKVGDAISDRNSREESSRTENPLSISSMFDSKSEDAKSKNSGVSGLVSELLSKFDKKDKGINGAQNLVGSWYDNIAEGISKVASSGFIKIWSTIQTYSPFIAIAGAILSVASQIIVPLTIAIKAVKIVFGLLGGIVDIMKGFGKLTEAALNYSKSAKYSAMADLLKSMAYPLLSMAALIGTIVLAAYVIDKYDLGKVATSIAIWTTALIGIILAFVQAFHVMSVVGVMFDRVNKILINARNVYQPTEQKRARDTFTSVLHELTGMFVALAVDLGVLIAAVVIFSQLDFWNELVPAIAALGALMFITIAMTAAMVGLGRTMGNETKSLKGFNLKTKTWTDQVSSNGTVIHKMMLALAGYLAVVIAGVKLFSGMSAGEIAKGMVTITIAIALLGGFIYAVARSTADFYKQTGNLNFGSINALAKDMYSARAPLEMKQKVRSGSQSDASSLSAIVRIIGAVGTFISAISFSIRLLKSVPIGNIISAGAIISLDMGLLAYIIKTIAKSAKELAGVKDADKIISSMKSTIYSVSVMILSLGASMSLMSKMDQGSLWSSMVALNLTFFILTTILEIFTEYVDDLNMGDTLSKVASSIQTMAVSLSIIMISLAGMFLMLNKVDWESMRGSAGYLIGAAVFVGSMVVLVMALSTLIQSEKVIYAASVMIAAIAGLLLSIGYMFTLLGNVPWDAVKDSWPFLLGAIAVMTGVMVFAGVIANTGPIAAIAIGAIAAISAMFLALGAMAMLIGQGTKLLGEGIKDIVDAIKILFLVPWDNAAKIIGGLSVLIAGIISCMSMMRFASIEGAISLAAVAALISFGVKQLMSINPEQIKMAAAAIVQFFTSLSEGLEGKEGVLDLLTQFSLALPLIIKNIAEAAIALAIGGVGLVAFAFEMLLFTSLMQLVGQQIGPAFELIVNGILAAGDAILPNAAMLFTGIVMIVVFAGLLTIAGTTIIAAGLLMTIGSLGLLAAGTLLGTAVSTLVESMIMAGDVIFQNAADILGAVILLNTFSAMLIPVGIGMIIAGGLLTAGGGLMLSGATLILLAVTTFANAATVVVVAANRIVAGIRATVAQIKALFTDVSQLPAAFMQSGINIVQGFINGITGSAQYAFTAMQGLASGILESFRAVIGEHSPATEFIKSGINTIAGFVQGIVESTPGAVGVMEALGINIDDAFNVDLSDDAADGATSFCDTLIAGFDEMFPDLNEVFTGMMDTLGYNGMTSLLNQTSAGLNAYQNMVAEAGILTPEQQARYDEIYATGGTSAAEAYRSSIATQNLDTLEREYRDWNSPLDIGDFNFSSPYTSSMGGGADYTSDLASSISGSSGAGSGINDVSKSGSIGGGVGNTITNSNNTYNFVQNNYSPEALDRSEIYTQTRNQLNSYYRFNLETNLAK